MSKKIELPNLGLYEVQKKDYDKAEKILNDAFVDDPCLLFLLNSNVYDKNIARHLHRYSMEYAGRYGKILSTSENLEAIALLLPPNDKKNIFKEIASGGLTLKKKTYKDVVKVTKAYSDFSMKLHHESISTPHWYLQSLVVDIEQQGKHFCSKLMKPFLNYWDTVGIPCYLETHKEVNVKIYEHYGFKITIETTMPGTQTTQWAMVRMPDKIS